VGHYSAIEDGRTSPLHLHLHLENDYSLGFHLAQSPLGDYCEKNSGFVRMNRIGFLKRIGIGGPFDFDFDKLAGCRGLLGHSLIPRALNQGEGVHLVFHKRL